MMDELTGARAAGRCDAIAGGGGGDTAAGGGADGPSSTSAGAVAATEGACSELEGPGLES